MCVCVWGGGAEEISNWQLWRKGDDDLDQSTRPRAKDVPGKIALS